MKYLVVSDIHGSAYYAGVLLEIIEEEKPDKIMLFGDLYYHGPRNGLTEEYNPMEVCEILNGLKDKIFAVKGNCDAEVDEMISDFKMTETRKIDIFGKTFIFTHGHKYNISNYPNEHFDFLVYGHLHTGFIQKSDGKVFVNAGSISLPKDGTENSYVIIENGRVYLKNVDGEIIKEISY